MLFERVLHGRSCALVTSNFHLARSQAIFSKCFELANKSQQTGQGKLQLACYGAEDDDAMSEEVLRARNEKELQSLKVSIHLFLKNNYRRRMSLRRYIW